MPNPYFRFKKFTVYHNRCAMKVTTDACLFGAWVASALQGLPNTPDRLLDVGTGTGLLSLMVAQKTRGFIDAVEIDPAAAEQAQENCSASPWKDRISVVPGDVLNRNTGTKYDVILSNPPFYENELRSSHRGKNMAHHDEGLKLGDLFRFIKKQLADDGIFFLLLPAKRDSELEERFSANQLFLQQKIYVQQTPKHQPFRMMIQGSLQKATAVSETIISIKNEQDSYTPEFIDLLHDYYLYLSMAS